MVPGPNAASSVLLLSPTTAISTKLRMGLMIQTPRVGNMKRSSASVLIGASSSTTASTSSAKENEVKMLKFKICTVQWI